MSLATLARKTKAKKRLRTRGNFILNMTGRGNVLGMNAKMSRGNCKGLTKCAGKRAACCVGVGGDEPGCCRFPHGGKPAPQMGYRVYLNRKSKGAYRPAGGKQCKDITGCTKAKSVWKQGSNLDASVVTTNRKDNVLACNSDVYTAKRDTCTCEEFNPVSISIGTQTNTMTVGLNGTTYGFSSSIPIGNFTPATINGASTGFVSYEGAALSKIFSVGLAPSGLPLDYFTAISFVDDCNVRTYKTADHSFFSSAANTIWQWKAPTAGYTAAEEDAYWASVAGKSLDVYVIGGTSVNTTIPTVTNLCPPCCCPVKKNICGCRATDLLRYTRINKSFGCQTTKAVRMGRSASEQIARRRAAVDCIKPTHKNIYMTTGGSTVSFKGCCGNQCLIEGHRYTFHFEALIDTNYPIYIEWCPGLREIVAGKLNGGDTAATTLTVPAVNCSTPGRGFAKLQVATGPGGTGIVDIGLTFEYCKEAFKRPQMLGSCSGR